MTIIAGIIEDGVCWLGADSAATGGGLRTLIADGKVWRFGQAVIGVAGSPRLAQLLRYKLEPPPHDLSALDIQRYLATEFVDAMRKCAQQGGHARKDQDRESMAASVLVGYQGGLYVVHGDYYVMQSTDPYAAIGSGGELALGVLYSTMGHPAKARLKLALDAACKYNSGCHPPYTYVKGGKPAERVA